MSYTTYSKTADNKSILFKKTGPSPLGDTANTTDNYK